MIPVRLEAGYWDSRRVSRISPRKEGCPRALRHHDGHSSVAGSDITNAAPPSSDDSTCSDPPWLCVTMSYESDRPTPAPDPVGLVVKNGSKTLPRISSGTPGPLSETRISARPISRPSRSVQSDATCDLLGQRHETVVRRPNLLVRHVLRHRDHYVHVGSVFFSPRTRISNRLAP